MPVSDLAAECSEKITPLSERRYLTFEAASEYVMLSKRSLYRLVSAGMLTPYRPVRGRVLLDRLQLESVVRSATVQPRAGRGRALQGGR